MVLLSLLVMASVGNPQQCRVEYERLSAYHEQGSGIVTRQQVDNGRGLEYGEVLKHQIEMQTAVEPILEELRRGALDMTSQQCRSLREEGVRRINEVFRKYRYWH